MNQVIHLHPKYDDLQLKYGDPTLSSIYGAGNIHNPNIMFIFMNPTGRNISSNPNWEGIKAPWLGTKSVWNIFNSLNILNSDTYFLIQNIKPNDWDIDISNRIYSELEENSIYLTNLAKCTQLDARPLSNTVFEEYLDLMYEEIEYIKPNKIVTFGNQVSSILLNKNISVSKYIDIDKEILNIHNEYEVYPTYYPVGQGRRNMDKAIERIKQIINK